MPPPETRIATERDQTPHPGPAPAPARGRRGLLAALVLGAAGLAVSFTDVEVSGNWQGIFLVRGKGTRALVLKDDLFLGDGSRLLAGVSFSRFRRLVGHQPVDGRPHLQVEWSDAQGQGLVRNHLGDGTELVTMFSRFTDDEERIAHGLFVGGALPDVARSTDQEESGMSFRDRTGWHHVWCTTNELMLDYDAQKIIYPSYWEYLGGRVIIRDADRVVIESSHVVHLAGGGTVRMDRYVYFRAGRPWLKLGIRLSNAGEVPVRLAYGYGDEPWVGHYGSAVDNVGWIRDQLVRVEGPVDGAGARWAGIVDEESGIAAFLAWSAESTPDRIYFANEAGSNFKRLGEPLDSNEVFVGTEWLRLALRPGEARSLLLSVGMARGAPRGGVPVIPEGGIP